MAHLPLPSLITGGYANQFSVALWRLFLAISWWATSLKQLFQRFAFWKLNFHKFSRFNRRYKTEFESTTSHWTRSWSGGCPKSLVYSDIIQTTPNIIKQLILPSYLGIIDRLPGFTFLSIEHPNILPAIPNIFYLYLKYPNGKWQSDTLCTLA